MAYKAHPLENTVREYTKEVEALFSEMVDRSREDHEHMRSLLTGEESDEDQPEETSENETEMSDYEKRLERMERENESKPDRKGRK